ncbi:MAG: TraL conjugative transposon family protein [Bacteroides sp.]
MKIKEKIIQFQDWTDDKLRQFCGRMSPEKRLVILLIMFALFGFGSIYIMGNAIYQIGKNEGQQIEIEHIKQLRLNSKDSINQFNYNDYERE